MRHPILIPIPAPRLPKVEPELIPCNLVIARLRSLREAGVRVYEMKVVKRGGNRFYTLLTE